MPAFLNASDRKSTRLNSSHTVIYTLSLHDALPICDQPIEIRLARAFRHRTKLVTVRVITKTDARVFERLRSEEHTSELQSHRDLHSFPTRRSSDLRPADRNTSRSRLPPPDETRNRACDNKNGCPRF